MNNGSKLLFVDAIRGIAILMVITVHTAQKITDLNPIIDGFAKYGQMGVQLFFVASAYTLCTSYHNRANEKYRNISFYIRRFFRIAPLYYLGIIIYFTQHALLTAPTDNYSFYPYDTINIISNITFTHGFYPPANNVIVPGGWSIGTEMAFYAICPLLFIHVTKLKTALFFTFISAATTILISIIILPKTGLDIANNNFTYYNLLNQLPVFASGISAYYLAKPGEPTRIPRWVSLITFMALTVIALIMWRQKQPILFSIIPSISGLSFAFLLIFLSATQLKTSNLLAKIGKVSFPMYIFHFLLAWGPSQALAHHLLPKTSTPGLTLLFSLTIVVVTTYHLSKFTQKHIEHHGITYGKKIIKSLKSKQQSTASAAIIAPEHNE